MKAAPTPIEMRRAWTRKDPSYDGVFFVGVRTTGIFCRPSCPARRPRPNNVVYRATARDCLLDGFRPCRRCRPLAVTGSPPDWLDAVLDRVERRPAERLTDRDLRSMGVDPHRVRRYFMRNLGMTFQAYHRARRMGMALEQLRRGGDSLTVGYDHGFESASGFRNAFARTFGATPGKSRDVARITTVRIESPVGPLIAGADDDGVCLLEFADRRALDRQLATLRRRFGATMVPGAHPRLTRLERELDEYFAGRRTTFTVPISLKGTEFQLRVWNKLREIPHGETWSYERLARAIGRPGASRAVGRANGANRVVILIPCHRVIRADGSLCGYGGGLWRKKFLLGLEQGRVGSVGQTSRNVI